MDEGFITLAQFKALRRFADANHLIDRTLEIKSFYKGAIELHGYADDRGWRPVGREMYAWFDSEGHLLATAAREMEDGGKAPLAKEPKRPTIVVASFSGASLPPKPGEEHALYSARAKHFFTIGARTGIVPKLRELVCSYMDGRTLDHG